MSEGIGHPFFFNQNIKFSKINTTFEAKRLNMTTIYGVYDQLAEMIARVDPEKVMAMKSSDELQKRFNFLSEKLRNSGLSSKEKDELNHFIFIERLFRMAKIKADLIK